MILINTVDEKYFTLDGVQFARIYQPLAQGSQAIGLYNKFDTKQQLKNSTKYDEFLIDGVAFGSQEETIAALLDVIYSGVSEYDVEALEQRVGNLEENQVTGVQVYSTYADLPAIGTLLVSYKVSNDPTAGLNGYYHWDSADYVKDLDLIDESLKDITFYLSGNEYPNEDMRVNASDGTLQASGIGLDSTDFVELKGGVMVLGYSSAATAVLAYYDENKIFISSISGTENNYTLLNIKEADVPANAKYVRSNTAEGLGFLLTDSVKDAYSYIDEEVAKVFQVVRNGNIDISNVSLVDGYIIRSDNGGTLTDTSKLSATLEYIECEESDIVEISVPKNVTSIIAGIAFYDENKVFVSGIPRPVGDLGAIVNKYVVPIGVKYFRLTYWDSANRLIHGEFTGFINIYSPLDRIEVSLDNREVVDGNSINVSDGSLFTGSSVMGCTSYIDCFSVSTIEITVPVLTTSPSNGLAFYDEDKNFISGVLRPQGGANDVEVQTIEVPSNAHYFRASFWNYANGELYGRFYCNLSYVKGVLSEAKKRPFQDSQIHYRVEVNQAVSNFWDSGAINQEPEDFKGSTGVLILPDNYSKDGRPVPVIMWCHGMSRNVTYTEWGLNYQPYLDQKERFRAAGYAVFDCQGQRDNGGANIITSGAPQAVDAYRKCFEYVHEHYNVEDDIYIIGASMGGDMALNYCNHFQNVKALALFSAWTDLFGCSWGQGVRDVFVEYYGFNNTTTYEEEKVVGYDPSLRIQSINGVDRLVHSKHPVKLWIGSLESASVLYPIAFNYINALRAGGSMAQVREITGAGHEITNGGSLVADAEVITWFNKN